MPPVAPSVLTLSQPIPGAPLAEISWSHASPATVNRWILYYRRPQDAALKTYGVFARDELVDGLGGYVADVPSPVDTVWTVGAMDSVGAISPVRQGTFDDDASGVWLFPFKGAVLQDSLVVALAGDLSRRRPISSVTYLPPYEEDQIVSVGKAHTADGRVDGLLREITIGSELTREQIEERLDRIIDEQQTYRIAIATAKRFYRSIAFVESVDYVESAGDGQKTVSFPFVVVP